MNNNEKYNTEDIKKGAQDAFNETKEVFKNLDVKSEAKATEGFLKDFIKNPLDAVNTSVSGGSKNFTLAVILVAIWIAAAFIIQFVQFVRFNHVGFLSIIQAIVGPALSIIVLSGIVMVFNKDTNKSITDLITIITITRIPIIAVTVLNILSVISIQFFRLTSPVSTFASVISTILLYFAVKKTLGEENDSKFFITFAKIYGLFVVLRFLLTFLEIGI